MVLLKPGPDRLRASQRAQLRRRLLRSAAGLFAAVLVIMAGRSLAAGFEQQARDRIRTALDQNEMEWVQLHVAGRRAQLKGERPELGHGGKALEVVRGARCTLLMVPVSCASSVTADFGELEPSRAVDADT